MHQRRSRHHGFKAASNRFYLRQFRHFMSQKAGLWMSGMARGGKSHGLGADMRRTASPRASAPRRSPAAMADVEMAPAAGLKRKDEDTKVLSPSNGARRPK
jgi:hypothetical protein